MDYGKEALKIIRLQHQYRICLTDGNILITNPLMYQLCEDELERLYHIISAQNIKRFMKYPEMKKKYLYHKKHGK